MGEYFGADGFRGEAGITLTADYDYKVGRFFWAGTITLCVSTTATTSLHASSLARTPAAALICSSTVWSQV